MTNNTKQYLVGFGVPIVVLLFVFFYVWPLEEKLTEEPQPYAWKEQRQRTHENKLAAETKPISTSDFEIVSFQSRWYEDYLEVGQDTLKIIGELRNNGAVAAGAEIEVIARDVHGTLVDSETFWPASIRNIPPGGTCGIEHSITHDRRAKTLEVKVVRVTIW